MSSVINVRDPASGEWVPIPALKGKSAYQYAQEGGYAGTEGEFCEILARTGTLTRATLLANWYFAGAEIWAKAGSPILYPGGAAAGTLIVDTQTQYEIEANQYFYIEFNGTICRVDKAHCYYKGGKFPINQRGGLLYQGSHIYAFDRWKLGENVDLRFFPDGISFSGPIETNYIYTYIENGLMAGTYTFSVLFKDNTGMVAIDNAIAENRSFENVASSEENGLISWTFTTDGISQEQSYQRIWISDSAKIIAAKLELGSTQTLAHEENGGYSLNEIPNYGEQLERCQRYFQRYTATSDYGYLCTGLDNGGANVYGLLSLPVPMRVIPSISVNNIANFFVRNAGVGTINLNDLRYQTTDKDPPGNVKYITLSAVTSGLNTKGTGYWIFMNKSGVLDFSADL